MRSSISAACLALAGAAVATGTVEFTLSKRDASGNPSDVARGVLLRRQETAETVEESVFDVLPWSEGGAYYTNISVGTPPQVQTVILDTGSSDTYLDARDATACETTGEYSCRGGTFNSGSSSTYKVTIPNGFSTSFGDGSTATGDFATDVVQIGDVAIDNVQFGLASNVNSTTGFAVGLMGIGYSLNEASSTQYANMPEVLRDSGAINSRLYSVFLNDLGDASGTILFGGIDTSKYTGDLVTLNLLPVPLQTQQGTYNLIYEFVVEVTAFSANNAGKTTSFFSGGDASTQSSDSLAVLLDTGSAAWTLPTKWYNDVAKLIPNLDEYGNLPCSAQSQNLNLSLTFGSKVTINVPMSELVVPVYDSLTNQQNMTTDGQPLCTFMLTPGEETSDQPFLTLGDAILRSMYVVFDLDNGQVSIAQASVNTTTDASSSGSGNSIKVVQAGAGGVASAVGSGVSTAPANSGTIAPAVSATASFSKITTSPAVGQATGEAAIPDSGRVTEATGSGSSGSSGSSASSGVSGASGTSSASAKSSSSKGAASGVKVPALSMAVAWTGVVVLGSAAFGAALIL